MSKVQTDNSRLYEKIDIRLDVLRKIDKQVVSVLECFGGDGIVWAEVERLSGRKIERIRIDTKADKTGVYLKGDNLKFLKTMDLSTFDIIDLDAYGSPYKQLSIVFKSQFRGFCICTYIQSGMGCLDKKMLLELGYTQSMIKAIPSIFNRNPLDKFFSYLWRYGVKKANGYFFDRKNYF